MNELRAGDKIRVSDDTLDHQSNTERKKYAGRIGLVEATFTPQGGTRAMARVRWLHKTTGNPSPFTETWLARLLVPASAACNSSEGPAA